MKVDWERLHLILTNAWNLGSWILYFDRRIDWCCQTMNSDMMWLAADTSVISYSIEHYYSILLLPTFLHWSCCSQHGALIKGFNCSFQNVLYHLKVEITFPQLYYERISQVMYRYTNESCEDSSACKTHGLLIAIKG